MIALFALSLAPTGFAKVEARYSRGLPVIAAEAEPGKKAWFLLDTGAPRSVFNGKFLEDWSGPRFKMGVRSYEFPTVRDEAFKGGIEPDGTAIVGVVGCDFLKGTSFLTAPATGSLWMRLGPAVGRADAERALREVDPAAKADRLMVLPLERTDDGYYARGRIGGKPARIAFDTGSGVMTATKAQVAAARGRALGKRAISEYDGIAESGVWLVPSVEIGPKRILFPSVVDEGQHGDEAVVDPLDLGRTVLVDLPGKAVYWLEPTAPSARIDGAIASLIDAPVRPLPDGGIALDYDLMQGRRTDPRTAPRVLSVQGETIATLRALVRRAASGEAKALASWVRLHRAQLLKPRLTVSVGGKVRSF